MKNLFKSFQTFFAKLIARFKKQPAVQTPAVETPPFVVTPTPTPTPVAPSAPSITDLLFPKPTVEFTPGNAPVETPRPSVSGDNLDFELVKGQNMILAGSFKKTFSNCPASVYFTVVGATQSPVTMVVNGVEKVADNPQALTRVQVSGPVVEVTVTQSGQADFTILAA